MSEQQYPESKVTRCPTAIAPGAGKFHIREDALKQMMREQREWNTPKASATNEIECARQASDAQEVVGADTP